jgi:beta-N-acetylhexosaminidase
VKTSLDPRPLLARRAVLKAGVLAAVGAIAAACARAIESPTPIASPSSSPVAPGPPVETSPTATVSAPAPPALTLRERIARLLVVGFKGLTVDEAPWIRRAIADDGLGGVILFDRHRNSTKPRNVDSPSQVRRLTTQLRALAPGRTLIVAVDQEGGIVTRLSPTHGFPAVASEATIGEAGDAAVEAWADGLAATVEAAGINLNLAPVVDLNVNPVNPAVGALDRAFSADPERVARDAAIEIAAHRRHEVRTALKHFPGLGSATANTDFGVADVTATWSDAELQPYRDLLGRDLVDVVMAAHVVNGQIDSSAPASLSAKTVDGLLRADLGWDGLVITDDLQAAAITQAFGFRESIHLALVAGNDLLLFANQQVYDDGIVGRVIDIVEDLVGDGTITEARIDASVQRVARLFPHDGHVPG